MKKTLLICVLLCAFFTSAQTHKYIKMEVITLKEGQHKNYLEIEEFFSAVKQLAVKKGLQTGWAVFKNIPNEENKIEGLTYPDYMVFNLYGSEEQMNADVDINSLVNEAHKGKTKRSTIKKMLTNWSAPRDVTRYYTYKRIANTDWGMGDMKAGLKLYGAPVKQLDENYINYELEFFKKNHDRQVASKERGWWELNEIIDSSDNALKEMTHIIFEAPGPMWGKVEVKEPSFTEKMMSENGIKTRKIWPHFEMELQYFAFN
ncbi:MAG: hypothetical protein ACON43_04160 [Flavobacteriaceae bacterium]